MGAGTIQGRSELDRLIALYDGLSEDAMHAIKIAYQKGRSDTLAELGLDENDLPQDDDLIAWAC